ncbi:MAG TPA: hypothetical protein VMM13_08440 [Euzebya sp.]|nr:hypothetical protein [Euzebya sp.]
MRKVIGGILSAGGGAAMAYGIIALVGIGSESCLGGRCLDGLQTDITFVIAGTLAFIISGFLWHGTWFVGPPVGLLTAFGLLARDGVALTGDSLGTAAFITVSVLLGPAILAVLVLRGRSKAKLAQRLVQTGNRAVAQVQGSQQTGVYINNRPQIRVRYLLHPLDGSPPFNHEKTQTLGFTEIVPRPGLAWPAWYDPSDPAKVAIGAPSGAALDASTEATLARFGLTLTQVYGYDPRGGPAPAAVPGAPSGF